MGGLFWRWGGGWEGGGVRVEERREGQDGSLFFDTAPERCRESRSVLLYVHRNIRLIRDGEPRTATSSCATSFVSFNVALRLQTP